MKHLWRTGGLVAVLLGSYLVLPAQAQIDVNTRLRDFLAGTFDGTLTMTGPILAPNGTAPLPAYSFSAEPTLGFRRTSAALVGLEGALTASSNITGSNLFATTNVSLGNAGAIYWTTRAGIRSPADGTVTIANGANTIGSQLKVDALPTTGTCGTSPAVAAGSTPFAGQVDVGTGTPASCVVVFGGTAFPTAPFCTANIVSATASEARAIAVVATTAQVTFTPATAFVASVDVAWHCISAK